jgi:hypothetical protein
MHLHYVLLMVCEKHQLLFNRQLKRNAFQKDREFIKDTLKKIQKIRKSHNKKLVPF